MEYRNKTKDQLLEDIQHLLPSSENALGLLEASPVCTKIVDLDFNLKYMSSAGIKDLKINDITEYYGQPYPLYFYPEPFRTNMTNNLVKAKRYGKVIDHEGVVNDIENNEQYYHSTLVPVKNGRREIESIMIVSTNITAQKQAEYALKQSLENLEMQVDARTAELKIIEQRFTAAMQAANDGLWDWNLETDEVYFSPRWKSMLGYGEEELYGTLDTFVTLVHPDDKEKVMKVARDYIGGSIDFFETEIAMRHKDGHDIIVLSRAFLVRRKVDDKPIRLIGTHVDVTERKKSEQFILDTSDILKMIALREPKEKIYDAIAYLYESRHPGLRCSMLLLEGNKLMHAGAPSMPKEYSDAINGLENGPTVGSCGTATYYGVRVVVEDIDTDPKWEKIKHVALPHGMRCCWSEPIKNSKGDVLGAFGMYYDHPASPNDAESNDMSSAARLAGIIMEREKSEKELEQHRQNLEELVSKRTRQFEDAKIEAETANRSKSQFLANMSHEIRTPMNGVLGMAEILLLSNLSEDQHPYVKRIQNSGESLLSIINNILDFSKIEARELKLESVHFNLKRLIEDAIQLFPSLANEKGLELEMLIEKQSHLSFMGDPTRLRQILVNLIGNAIKFTENGNVLVKLSTFPRDDNRVDIKISVIDTGIGIRSEDKRRLFQPFSQLDGSTTREYGGTGLGLAITNELVSLMGGSLDCESSLGNGAEFFFTIPLKKSYDEDLLQQQVHKVDHSALTPVLNFPNTKERPSLDCHVLVAEDNETNREVFKEMLRELGYKVTMAKDGKEAVELFMKYLPDLVLMDCQMPIMDGYQATDEIRKNEKKLNIETPILAITAHAMKGDRDHCLIAGMNDYLTKPFKIEELKTILMRWDQRKKNTTSDIKTDIPRQPENIPIISQETKIFKGGTAAIDSTVLQAIKDLQIEGESSLLLRVLDIYISDTEAKIAQFRDKSSNLTIEDLQRIAHSLKSSSANVGAMGLSEICKEIELGCRDNSIDNIEAQVIKIESEFRMVKSELKIEISQL